MNELPLHYFAMNLYFEASKKMDDLIYSSFQSLGYSEEWLMENKDRITVDIISSSNALNETWIYKLDGKPLFGIRKNVDFIHEGDTHKVLFDWEVQYDF